jgi:DNA-binding MarR family transcriptional regulator
MPKMSELRRALLDAIGSRLKEVTSLSAIYSQAMASRLGINMTDLECLCLAARERGITAGAIAEATGLTTGATTTAIDRLERAGFAQRVADKSDRRKVIVVATSAIKRRSEDLGTPMQEIVDGVVSQYDDDQIKFLDQALTELCEAAKRVINSARQAKRSSRKGSP